MMNALFPPFTSNMLLSPQPFMVTLYQVSTWFTFALVGMEDARNTKENTPSESSSLSGVSLPNEQPNSASQVSEHINGNVTTEAQHLVVDSSKLEHLKEDSRGISPDEDYPSLAGNLDTISPVKTGDTGKVTETETPQHSSQIA